MKIQTPLKHAGVVLRDDNKEWWERLSNGEKLFYKYILEYDTTLSSILLGVFTAYVVNLTSNLVTFNVTDLFVFVIYVFNVIFAFIILYFLMKLYRIHVILEKQSINNAISIRVNNDCQFLQKKSDNIAYNVKSLKEAVVGFIITFICCFAFNNGLRSTIYTMLDWINKVIM